MGIGGELARGGCFVDQADLCSIADQPVRRQHLDGARSVPFPILVFRVCPKRDDALARMIVLHATHRTLVRLG